ncbi:hypothetical protein FQN53_002993 [Emmonsiellopsis sp. PD_33]|nr:hypothetical protein FQN53_002993 [Emmonsiellopsis sp. PD_33]
MDPPPPQSLRKRLRSYLSRASLQTITDKNTVRKDKEINKSKRGADFPAMPSDEIDHYDPGHKCDRRGIPKDSPFTTMGVYGETHGERVRYLQDLKDAQLLCPKHYPNLDAAIEHHKQFPANEEYPDMLVHFQNGKVVEKKDLDARCPLWLEITRIFWEARALDCLNKCLPANSPEPEKATSAIYGWNTVRNQYNSVYLQYWCNRFNVYYDPGSTMLSFNFTDRAILGISEEDCLLIMMTISTATRTKIASYYVWYQTILNEKHEFPVPWSDEYLISLLNRLLQDNRQISVCCKVSR